MDKVEESLEKINRACDDVNLDDAIKNLEESLKETYQAYTITAMSETEDEETSFGFYRCFDSQKEAKSAFELLASFYTGQEIYLELEKDLIDRRSSTVLGSKKLIRFRMITDQILIEDLQIDWDADVMTLEETRRDRNTDVHLSKVFGIPTRTLQDWKNRPDDNWRKKVYLYLNDTWL